MDIGTQYLSGLKSVNVHSVVQVGDAVTIIGTKYCAGAHDYLVSASRVEAAEEQCLYLVADPKSKDVVLHNGKFRLGTVAPTHAAHVRAFLTRIASDEGVDNVLVCKMKIVPYGSDGPRSFKLQSSFNVTPVFYVYERLARKFSDKYRKEN